MTNLKDQMIRCIGSHAAANVADLAAKFIRAEAQEKEAILAGLDFERWLEQCCRECLN